jgi:hypothetical protein
MDQTYERGGLGQGGFEAGEDAMSETDDDLIQIPAEFWGNFGERDDRFRLLQTANLPDGTILKKWSDGLVTSEDWVNGDFHLYDLQPDGSSKHRDGYNGIMFDRAEIMRLFPKAKP